MGAPDLRVLLIEDCRVHAILIRGLLNGDSDESFALDWVTTLSAGFASLRSNDIHVVLLNLLLADSEGLETFRRINEQFPAVPVVILTGAEHEGLAVQALHEGCQDYLVKGQVSAELLKRSLRFAMERHVRGQLEASLRATERELRIARQIQDQLCRRKEWVLQGYDMAAVSYPAEFACGDFFDVLPLSEDWLGIVVGDVCGHGLGPALLAAETRTYLRTLALTHDDIREILAIANRLLTADIADDRFVTVFFAKLHVPTGSLVYASAGQRAYHVDTMGVLTHLESTCPPLGLHGDMVVPDCIELILQPGEVVLVPTDGLLESMTPGYEVFGIERILDGVSRHRHETAQQILERIYRSARTLARGTRQKDDITAVLLKVGSTPSVLVAGMPNQEDGLQRPPFDPAWQIE